MPGLFDLVGKLFGKQPSGNSASETAGADAPVSVAVHEVSEHRPWSIERLLDHLETIQPLDTNGALGALASQRDMLAVALKASLAERTGRARVTAGALLLLLDDSVGREPFLQALDGPDGEARSLALSYLAYCVCPSDIDLRGASGMNCPIMSGEVFAALQRDLHEPWTGQSAKVLHLVAGMDFPQARDITRAVLSHPDPALRQQMAKSYLRSGRDDGAFAILQQMLREAPPHHPHREAGAADFYQKKTLWYTIEEAARRGDQALAGKAAALSMEFLADALDAPDRVLRFDFNDGLVDATCAAKTIALVKPAGGREILERLIEADDLDPYQRGQALLAYSLMAGETARPVILAALQDKALREYAARAFQPLLKGDDGPTGIAALSAALDDEERPNVVAALAKALLAAGPGGEGAVERVIEYAEPWARVELSWRIAGGTDREFANLLIDSGVMDPIDDAALEKAVASGLDVQSLIWAGGERLVVFMVKASSGLEHYKLFESLLAVARPAVAVHDLREVIDAQVVREPMFGTPHIQRVTDLGTVCAISFDHLGQPFGFDVHPQGRWHDVAGVMRGFDAFMESLGRDDRCYELSGDGEWGMFVVAPAARFDPIAARLRLPIETDPAGARDAAKAYQRQVQDM